tara:strand:- start:129 stop:533 length:405 start_codon:yes stop_codon:yes gene_type:complete
LTLANNNVDSGSHVPNLQKSVNKNASVVFAEASKTEGDTIALDLLSSTQDHAVLGNGVAVTLNALPFGSSQACEDGATITIIGGSDALSVKLVDNRNVAFGCVLNGSATLGIYDTLVLKFNLQKQRYIQVGRNF